MTGDKLFCIYLADDEDALREHGRRGGFPVDGIYEMTGDVRPDDGDRARWRHDRRAARRRGRRPRRSGRRAGDRW